MISPLPSISAESAPNNWAPTTIEDFSTSQKHRIRSAGFQFALLDTALRDLFNRWKKNRLSPTTAATLDNLFGAESAAAALSDGPTAIEFHSNEDSLKVIGSDQPSIADPRHWALLHLPGLRSWWTPVLRSTHFESLRALVPNAWTVEDAKLPPGSVIVGLDIPDWSHLPRCIATGRRFVLWERVSGSAVEIQAVSAPQSGGVLIEVPACAQRLKANYVKTDSRIELKQLQIHR
ncbi:MAG: hypothetical protein KDK97_14630 [Verrucomicrobiales bacterium]|nr:hypothetical protein [Verrucomicrobiales bacterium]MCP5559124.1 hypothetical protein [Verrucomicrobiaceae bacterium]